MQDLSPSGWLDFLLELAARADATALAWFRRDDLDVAAKSDRTPVTAADLEIERDVRTLTQTRFPQLGLIGEEYGASASAAINLIVDPIDGTANYARGIPIFATLLAIEADGEVLAGVVSAPALGTRWHAARGVGAFRNGARIRVSATDRLADAQVFHGGIAGVERNAEVPGFMDLLRTSKRQRGFGDFYQHMLVAEGAGEIAIDIGLAPWDIAALTVVIDEAGGRWSALDARRDIHATSLITTNAVLHEKTLSVLAGTSR